MKPFRWLLLAAEAYHRATFLSVSNIVFCGRRGKYKWERLGAER
jgi:hypothetical protein